MESVAAPFWRRQLRTSSIATLGEKRNLRADLGGAGRMLRGIGRCFVGMAKRRRGYGQSTFWRRPDWPQPHRQRKDGHKKSVIVEQDGGPLGVVLAGANVHDTKLLAATIEALVV